MSEWKGDVILSLSYKTMCGSMPHISCSIPHPTANLTPWGTQGDMYFSWKDACAFSSPSSPRSCYCSFYKRWLASSLGISTGQSRGKKSKQLEIKVEALSFPWFLEVYLSWCHANNSRLWLFFLSASKCSYFLQALNFCSHKNQLCCPCKSRAIVGVEVLNCGCWCNA